jgi:hypothetical protein
MSIRPTRFAARRRARPDVFMIGYGELNLAENWARLQQMQPTARLVQGIPGIFEAYRHCAELARAPLFFAVDADNYLIDGFDFLPPRLPAPNELIVWRARNPINGLAYGHGGIKLFPTDIFRPGSTIPSVDISTSIAARTITIDRIASEHRFNTTPYRTWSVAFRECAKLGQHLAHARRKDRAEKLLASWCADGHTGDFAQWCVAGARDGRSYGHQYAHDKAALAKINDRAWLEREFRSAEERMNAGRPSARAQDAPL